MPADLLADRRPGSIAANAIGRPTRRRFLGGVAGTAAVAGLTACGGSSDSDGGSDGTGGSGGSGGSPAKRTITTARGRIEVPSDPQRVVCVDPGFSWQTLVEVGITPVGLPLVIDTITQPQLRAKVDGVPTVLDSNGEPDLEKIANVRPDLILANAATIDKSYAKLTAIAPVAAYAFNFPSDWTTLNQSYAAAVNRADRLRTVTQQYDQAVAQLKSQYGTVIARQKWALVTVSQNQVFVWGERSSAGPVLSAAGARFSSGAPGSKTPFTPLSLEKLDSLNDATVILYGAGTDGKPFADTGSLLSRPVFKQLPAAAAGHVYPLPSWFAYSYADALSQITGLGQVGKSLQSG